MKTDPVHEMSRDLQDSQRGKDFLSGIKAAVEADQSGRQGWLQKLDHYRRRRYGMEFRDPEYPWPGSSSVVLPLIDKKIDEIKPQYVNLITAARPPVTVLAIDRDSQENSGNVELWFEWLIKFGSPLFIEQSILAIDDLLETGRGILKTVWHYETRQTPEVITAARLPERLRRLVVTKKDNADDLYAMTGGQVPILHIREFDELRPKIEEVIKQEFELDREEPRDRKAFDSLMGWLRSGAKDDLRIEKRDIVRNVPGVVAVSPKDLIVPQNAPSDVEGIERFTHVMFFNEQQIKQKALDGEWNKEAVAKLMDARKRKESGSRRYSSEEADQAAREGVSDTEGNVYEVWETCCWWAKTENAPEKKAVLLWTPESDEIPLKFTDYYRASGKWPFHTAAFEHNKNRWHSPRGVPEKLDDLDYEITMQHRYKLNRATIATCPTFKFRPNKNINPSLWRWIPGQFMPTNDPAGDVLPVVMPQLDDVFRAEIQDLRVWAEDYLGGGDYGLANQSQLSEPRTAREISAIEGKAQQSLSLRGLLFQRMMQEVYGECFDLWHQYGNKQVWIRVTGGSEPIVLTKEELQGRFVFTPTGTIGEQSPAQEEQKALMRLQILGGLKEALEPRYELDLGAAVMDWLEKSDMRLTKRIIRRRTDQEVQQVLQQLQAAQQAQQMQQAALEQPEARPPLQLPPRQASRPQPTMAAAGGPRK